MNIFTQTDQLVNELDKASAIELDALSDQALLNANNFSIGYNRRRIWRLIAATVRLIVKHSSDDDK